jgi:WD40 repeat protein
MRALDAGRGTLARIAFSLDGTEIIGATPDSIKAWDVRTGRVRSSVPLERSITRPSFVGFSPQKDRIASGADQTATVWETATGRALLRLEGLQGVVTDIAFSPDGSWIATASHKRISLISEIAAAPRPELTVWEARTARRLSSLVGHADAITSLEFSPDNRYLISAGESVRRWRIPIALEPRTFSGHADAITGVVFSPDGARLATSSRDKTVRLWDIARGQVLRTLRGHTAEIHCVAFSPDGRHLASAASKRPYKPAGPGEIIIWDAIGGKTIHTFRGKTRAVTSLAFRPQSGELAWASVGPPISPDPSDQRISELAKRTFGSPAWDTAFLSFCDFRSGQQSREIERQSSLEILGMAFNGSGTQLALAGQLDGPIVLDAESGSEMRRYGDQCGIVVSVAFSPDGRYLASGSGDEFYLSAGELKVWDALRGQCVLTRKEQTRGVPALVFSLDGKRLATGGGDGLIKIWDLDTGQETLRLEGHTGPITSLAFSLDGTRLASASEDRTVRLWEAGADRE